MRRSLLASPLAVCLLTAWTGWSASQTLPMQPTGPTASNGFTLTFDDEFTGTSLNTKFWCPTTVGAGACNAPGWPNNSEATGAILPSNVSVANGSLQITAKAQAVTLYGKQFDHTTGVVQTYGPSPNSTPLFQQALGVFEARIWVPAVGTTDSQMANWPAFWLNGYQFPWPTNEIDIMEGHEGPACHLHSGGNPNDWQIADKNPLGSGVSTLAGTWSGSWHTYTADWQADAIYFYYDGSLVCTITDTVPGSQYPAQILINYDVSTNNAFTPQSASYPASISVDYVRVWKRNAPAQSLPDLVPTSLSYDSKTGLFTSVVMNQGNGATPNGVVIGVAYYVDGVKQTWGYVNGPLTVSNSVTIGTQGGAYSVPSGPHTIAVLADDASRMVESTRANNLLSEAITVGSSGSQTTASTPAPSPTANNNAPVPDITGFVARSDTNGTIIDAKPLVPRNANNAYALTKPDSQTVVFQLRSGDQWVGDRGTTNERTILDGSPTVYSLETPITTSFNVTFAPGSGNTAQWLDWAQFHNTDLQFGASTSPPVEFDLCAASGCGSAGDYMNIDIGWLASSNATIPANAGTLTGSNGVKLSYAYVFIDTNPIVRGHTYAMLIKAKFSQTDGYLQVWRDNLQIVNYAGPIGFFGANPPQGAGDYWGFGLYRAKTTNDVQVMTVDNWTINP